MKKKKCELKKAPGERKPLFGSFSRILCLMILLTAAPGLQHAFAQCTLVSTINISTGFNPASSTLITPGNNGDPQGTFPRDPMWMVSSISPDAVTAIWATGFTPVAIGTGADVVDVHPGGGPWVATGGSRWISCTNSNFYNTPNTTLLYDMVLTRTFTLCNNCCVNTIPTRFDFTTNFDNAAAISIDGIPCPSSGIFFRNLACGTHTISARITNVSPFLYMGNPNCNPTGFNLEGSISTTTNAILSESGDCSGFVCIQTPTAPIIGSSTLCVDETENYTDATPGGVWSIGPATPTVATVNSSGDVRGITAGTFTLTYTVTTPCPGVVYRTINVLPLPPVPFLTETTGNHCEGTSLNFCVTGAPGMEIIYSWSTEPGGPTSHIVPLSGGTFCLSVPAVYPGVTFHLEGIKDPATGCIRWLHNDLTICVDPHPAVGPMWGPNPICQGSTGAYSISGSGWGSGSVSWGYPSSMMTAVAMGTSTIHLMAISPGVATITYSVTNCCGSASGSMPVTINPLPAVPAITYTGCSAPCPGATLTYDLTGTPGSVVTWGWLDPSLVSHPGGTFTFPPSGGPVSVSIPTGAPGTYGLDIMSTILDDCPLGGFIHPIAVNWPTADFMQSPAPICEGGTAPLVIHGPAGGTVFMTATPGGGLGLTIPLDPITGAATVMVSPSVTTTYQITGVVGPCCTHMYAGASMVVTVVPLPVISMSSGSPVCYGTPLVLSVSCPACTEPYLWTGPDPSLPATTLVSVPNYTISWASASGTYLVTGGVYDIATNLTCTVTATTPVTVIPAPVATMSCTSTACMATLHFYGPPSGIVYYTSVPGPAPTFSVTLDGSGYGTAIATVPGTTTFVIANVVDVVTGCSSMMSYPGCTVTPLIPPAPVVTAYDMYDANGRCLAVFSSSAYPVDLELALEVAADPIPTGPWLWGAGPFPAYRTLTSSVPDPIYGCLISPADWLPGVPFWGGTTTFPANPCSPVDPTIYLHVSYVEATAVTHMGCRYPIFVSIDPNCAAIPAPRAGGSTEDLQHRSLLSVAPNPNKGSFTLSGFMPGLKENDNVTIETIDVLGRIVSTDHAVFTGGSIDKRIELGPEVANGVYLVKVKGNNASEIVRFTLSR